MFEVSCQFPIAYNPEDDLKVQEKMAKMKKDIGQATCDTGFRINKLSVKSLGSETSLDSDIDTDRTETDTESEFESNGSEMLKPTEYLTPEKLQRARRRKFTVLDKVGDVFFCQL